MQFQYTQLWLQFVLLFGLFQVGNGQDIVGGKTVEEGKYPFMVGLIEAGDPNLQTSISCGATILGDKWVLTAAHCVSEFNTSDGTWEAKSEQELEILFGTYNLENPLPGYRRIQIERIYINPSYKRVYFEDINGLKGSVPEADIALIKLTDPIYAPPVTIPETDDDDWEIEGLPVRVMGWGKPSRSQNVWSKSLKEANIEIINRETCKAFDYYDELLSDNMMCAGITNPDQEPAGGAVGDSGGPLVLEATKDGWMQLGIMSWGRYRYTQYEGPGVYQKVYKHLDWIKDVMDVTSVSDRLADGVVSIHRNGRQAQLSTSTALGISELRIFTMGGALIQLETLELQNGQNVLLTLPSDHEKMVFYLHSPEGHYTAIR